MKTLLLIIFLWAPSQTQPLQKVYVEWIDIVATDGGWHSEADLEDWIQNEPCTVYQVGFLYKETPEYIVLVDSYFTSDLKGYAVKIPRGCIVRITKL